MLYFNLDPFFSKTNNLNLASFSQNFVLVHTAEQPYSLLINIINLVIFQICYFFLHLIKLFQQLKYIHFSIWPCWQLDLCFIFYFAYPPVEVSGSWMISTYLQSTDFVCKLFIGSETYEGKATNLKQAKQNAALQVIL